jgi:hypothetical protein
VKRQEHLEDLNGNGGDSVDQHIRLLGQRNWKSLALNKKEPKKHLKAVEPMMIATSGQKHASDI